MFTSLAHDRSQSLSPPNLRWSDGGHLEAARVITVLAWGNERVTARSQASIVLVGFSCGLQRDARSRPRRQPRHHRCQPPIIHAHRVVRAIALAHTLRGRIIHLLSRPGICRYFVIPVLAGAPTLLGSKKPGWKTEPYEFSAWSGKQETGNRPRTFGPLFHRSTIHTYDPVHSSLASELTVQLACRSSTHHARIVCVWGIVELPAVRRPDQRFVLVRPMLGRVRRTWGSERRNRKTWLVVSPRA